MSFKNDFLDKNKYYILAFISCVILAWWMKNLIFNQPVIHPEFISTVSFMTKPADMGLSRIFDLSITEFSMYRPRVLSFLLQYIDSNFSVFILQFFPQWGARLLGYYLALGLIFLAALHLTKKLLIDCHFAIRLLFAIMPLVWLNTLGTLMLTLRSAKLMCVACIIFMFTIFIDNKKWSPSSSKLTILFYSLLFTSFYLIDEQIISYAALLTASAILWSYKDRQLHAFALFGFCSLAFYSVIYFTLLKEIFSHFTPDFVYAHVHNKSLLFANFSWHLMKKALSKYLWVIVNNFSFLLLFLAVALKKLSGQKQNNQALIFLFLLVGTLVNTIGIALMHPPIVTYVDLKVSMYYLPLLAIFYCLLLWAIREFFFNKLEMFACITAAILVLLTNMARFDYVLNHVKKGHLASFVPISNFLNQAIKENAYPCEDAIKLTHSMIPLLKILTTFELDILHFCNVFSHKASTKHTQLSSCPNNALNA